MRPTVTQRQRLAILEERLVRWLRFQPVIVLDSGLLDLVLGDLPPADRERVLALTRRAIDPVTGQVDGRRLSTHERADLGRLLGLRPAVAGQESKADGDDGF